MDEMELGLALLNKCLEEDPHDEVLRLLKSKADPTCADQDGRTPLMLSAAKGNGEVVSLLLQHGAPWNALDKNNNSAGDYAAAGKHLRVYEGLVDAGCTSELLLRRSTKEKPPPNLDYLKQKLIFKEGQILDANSDAVMMGWEVPLMVKHAEVLCTQEVPTLQKDENGREHNGLDVLNVGFGLGLIDTELQKQNPRTHTIIEAHPDVYAQMLKEGWDKKPGVNVVFGRWQDKLDDLGPFDGIFFDTYGEHYDEMLEFHAKLPRQLKPKGTYSFFNGLAASTNAFFHTVYCRLVELDLADKDMTCSYVQMDIEQVLADEKWEGVRRKYFILDTYNLPIIRKMEILDLCGDE